MVNLALTGRARSNVFNGVQDLGGLVLRGIDSRAEIGFLSLFEHYENIAVGSHLKSPRLPIWVVCSESHYTILFGLDPALSTSVPPLGRFDLFYYDELARQREEIRLSIDVSKSTPPQKDGDLEPPINGQRPPRPTPDGWTAVRGGFFVFCMIKGHSPLSCLPAVCAIGCLLLLRVVFRMHTHEMGQECARRLERSRAHPLNRARGRHLQLQPAQRRSRCNWQPLGSHGSSRRGYKNDLFFTFFFSFEQSNRRKQ